MSPPPLATLNPTAFNNTRSSSDIPPHIINQCSCRPAMNSLLASEPWRLQPRQRTPVPTNLIFPSLHYTITPFLSHFAVDEFPTKLRTSVQCQQPAKKARLNPEELCFWSAQSFFHCCLHLPVEKS